MADSPVEAPAPGVSRAQLGLSLQGDLVFGIALAVTGVGADSAADLPEALVGAKPVCDANGDWSAAFVPPSGWCAVLTQDCDLVRADDAEPTVAVAPVRLVKQSEHATYESSSYTGRYFALPRGCIPGAGALEGVIDLAWRGSLLKVSLEHPRVRFLRVLTEPRRADLGTWLAHREGRAPFPDDVVTSVLDPFDVVRSARKKSATNKPVGGLAVTERIVRAVTSWHAALDGTDVRIAGVISGQSLLAAGYSEEDINLFSSTDGAGQRRPAGGPIEIARQKLHTEVLTRMERDAAGSGYGLHLHLVDLELISAAAFKKMRLLVR